MTLLVRYWWYCKLSLLTILCSLWCVCAKMGNKQEFELSPTSLSLTKENIGRFLCICDGLWSGRLVTLSGVLETQHTRCLRQGSWGLAHLYSHCCDGLHDLRMLVSLALFFLPSPFYCLTLACCTLFFSQQALCLHPSNLGIFATE